MRVAERTKAGMAAARRRGAPIGRLPKLTPAQIEQARAELAAGKSMITGLARRFGVAPRTLSRALDR